jgi:hypothetical protein
MPWSRSHAAECSWSASPLSQTLATTRSSGQHAPADAFVHTKYGRQLSEEVLANRGSPERPLSPAEVLQKFQDNAGDALPCHARDQPAGRLLGLEQQPVVERTHAAARGRARVTGVATGVSRLPKRRASAGRRNKLRSQRRFIGFPWAMGLQNTASPTSRGSTPGMSRRSCGSAPCPGSEAAYSQRRTEAL